MGRSANRDTIKIDIAKNLKIRKIEGSRKIAKYEDDGVAEKVQSKVIEGGQREQLKDQIIEKHTSC